MNDIKSGTPLADALALVDAAQGNDIESERRLAWAKAAGMAATVRELEALRELAEAVRVSLLTFSEGDVLALAVTAIMAGEGDPNAKKRIVGDCGWCDAVAEMVAALGSDNDTQVCAACHANPGIPTVSLDALADETPVYVITRGDLAEMAWRDVTDQEAKIISGAIVDSGVRRSVSDIVAGVCGPHPAFAEEDE